MGIEGLAAVLRGLRSRVDPERALAAAAAGVTWPSSEAECIADLDAYDQALVTTAEMLEVPLPAPPEGDRRFTPAQRTEVEAALRHAGIEVTDAGGPA
ncbi:MAG: hypothetical protein KY452_04540 [Actinobacteria bacterium]|nr:hypothetical protein [Actinomycetota bacterium]